MGREMMVVFKKTMILFLFLSGFVKVNANENPIVNRFGQVGLVNLYSAKSLGFSRLAFSIQADFSSDDAYMGSFEYLYLDSLSGRMVTDTSFPEAALFSFRPNFAYGLTNFMDISLMIPVYLDILATQNSQIGIGDIETGLKIRIPGGQRKFHAALLSSFSFPTGTINNGYFPRHTYYFDYSPVIDSDIDILVARYSSKKVETELAALMTLDLNKFLFHLNSGVRFTYNKNLDEIFILGAGFEIVPVDFFTFFTEIKSETRFNNLKNGFKINEDPFRITPGVTFQTFSGASFTLAGSFKLSSNNDIFYYSEKKSSKFNTKLEPSWQISLQIGWSRGAVALDSDKDLIPDKDDACPFDAEDVDGFEDNDGCPDYDNDMDGIVDTLDKCPDSPEDIDGFEDEDGCPDYDNDNDGIPDTLDQCINLAEDRDGFNDHDGCPELDNDMDGIPDSIDRCPDIPEDIDGFEDEDGCPDIDNDMDGIPDTLDLCPNVPGVKEENGCPESKPKSREIQRGRVILQGVKFDGGSTALNLETTKNLDKLYESLVDWPEIKLEIQGHTDNSGKSAFSLKLSGERAENIFKYLVKKGISPDRLRSVGKGDTEPIADNSSIHGRKLNNKIEIHRID